MRHRAARISCHHKFSYCLLLPVICWPYFLYSRVYSCQNTFLIISVKAEMTQRHQQVTLRIYLKTFQKQRTLPLKFSLWLVNWCRAELTPTPISLDHLLHDGPTRAGPSSKVCWSFRIRGWGCEASRERIYYHRLNFQLNWTCFWSFTLPQNHFFLLNARMIKKRGIFFRKCFITFLSEVCVHFSSIWQQYLSTVWLGSNVFGWPSTSF